MTDVQTLAFRCLKYLRWIKACNGVLNHLEILKQHTMALEKGQWCYSKTINLTNVNNINQLVPCIKTVVWARRALKDHRIDKFTNFVNDYVSKDIVCSANRGEQVDEKLKAAYRTELPDMSGIPIYLDQLFKRFNLEADNLKKANTLKDSISTTTTLNTTGTNEDQRSRSGMPGGVNHTVSNSNNLNISPFSGGNNKKFYYGGQNRSRMY